MRKLVAVIMSVGLAVIPSLGGFSAETPSVELKGALCLTFDDHYLDSWCRELPRFAKFGAHATFFTSGAISSTDVGKLRQLKAAGHSLGLHGQNHTPATDAVAQYGADGFLMREVDPQLAVCQVAGLGVRNWAYPNSKNSDATDAALATRFRRLRCGGVYRDAIAGDPLSGHDLVFVPRAEAGDKLVLWSTPIPATLDGWQTDVRGAIQRTHDNDEVLVFHSHNIRNDNVKDAHDISGEQLEEILQMAADIGVSVIGFDELGGADPGKKEPEQPELPEGYLPMDYIESSGTQYIDTGVTNTSDDIVTIEFYVKPTQTKSMASFIYGARSGGIDRNYSLHVNEGTPGYGNVDHMQLNNDNDGVSVKLVHGAAGPVSGARFRTCISRSLRSIENLDTGVFVSNSETAAEYSTGKSAYLFAGNTEGHGKASLRLYSCKIVRAGVTLRDFVPCVRSSDMVAGLYDVSGQSEEPFYANQGEGKFAYPGYVHVSYADCTRLEYVRSSGQAYADTGFLAGPDTGFYIRFEPEDLTKDLCVLGSIDSSSGTAARMRLGRRTADDAATRGEYYVDKADQSSNMNSPMSAPQGGVHEIMLSGDTAWLDGTIPFSPTDLRLTKTLKNTVWVFDLNNCGQPLYEGKGFVGKLYGCTIFDEGRSAVNLLPMKDAAGRVGLYDSAKGVLRFSIGGAMFEPGPEAGACTEATAVELMAVQSVGLTSVRVIYDLVNLAEADGPCDLAFAWTDASGKTNMQVFAQGVAAAGSGAVIVNDVVAAADLAAGGTINGRIVVRSGDRACAESSAKSVVMPRESGSTSGYQLLQYVHTEGGWFDTKYSPGPKTAAEMTFSIEIDKSMCLFGTMTTSGSTFPNRFRAQVRDTTGGQKDGAYFVDVSNGGNICSTAKAAPDFNVIHTIYASVGLKSMDGDANAFSAADPSKALSATIAKSLYFGNINNFSTSPGPLTGNIYGCALYEDGKLVHQYQPAKRLLDNIVGFCDTVGGGFYRSGAGDATFTAGALKASPAEIVGAVVYRRDTTVKVRYTCKANERVFLAYGRAYGGSALSGWETTGVETGIAGASEGVKKVTLKGVTDATVGYVRVYAVDTDSNQIAWGNTYSLPQTVHKAGGFLLMLK